MKRVLIIDPYIDVLGGGERHILSIAHVLQEEGYAITLAWKDSAVLSHITSRFGFKNITTEAHFYEKNSIARLAYLRQFEFVFYVTDGSYFFSSAKKTCIFCMYPKKTIYQRTLMNKLKWAPVSFVANSYFTKKYIDTWTKKKSHVIYPYIDEGKFELCGPQVQKEKIILSVGRFYSHLHSKNHGFIIKTFTSLQKKHPAFKSFKLYIVGGLKEEDRDYFNEVQEMASQNKSIHVIPNIPDRTLSDLYSKAMFYWHGAGYGVNIRRDFDKVEHFGITPVEAMAAGAIVCSHNSGGQKEVITAGENGFLYDTPAQLISFTKKMYEDTDKRESVGTSAHQYAKKHFSYAAFKENVLKVLGL